MDDDGNLHRDLCRDGHEEAYGVALRRLLELYYCVWDYGRWQHLGQLQMLETEWTNYDGDPYNFTSEIKTVNVLGNISEPTECLRGVMKVDEEVAVGVEEDDGVKFYEDSSSKFDSRTSWESSSS